MGFAAEIDTERDFVRRSAQRAPVSLRTGFRKRGSQRTQVDVVDLSATGFQVDAPMALLPGTDVWITIPGIEPKSARVVWADGFRAGCEFHAPFHESVFERIVQLNSR